MTSAQNKPVRFEKCREANALAAIAKQLRQGPKSHERKHGRRFETHDTAGQPCHATEQQPSHSKDRELSTTALHVPEPATSSSTPPPKPRARRVDVVAAEELAEGQCSSGDPRPPKRRAVSDDAEQQPDAVAAARRVSKHVYKRLLPLLDVGVTDERVTEEAHGG